MRVVVTGGAGFVGRAVVERLRDRGDDVIALVRDPGAATHLVHERVTPIRSSLADPGSMRDAMRGADAVIHIAGMYRIGIAKADRPAMWDANVGVTERVLDAAIAERVGRILYVSTVNVFGDTKGAVVDETYHRDLAQGFTSWYDETKFRAHEAAEARIAAGAPIVIVMPSQVYGPHDHSLTSEQLHRAFHGTMRYLVLTSVGLGWVHVHDLADGMLSALDRGRAGDLYCLSGPNHTLAESIAIAAGLGGTRPPRFSMPTALARLVAPLNDALGGLPGSPPNLAETIRSADGVTYYATAAKAHRELGFMPRSLEQGIVDTWGRH
ncbi:MAG TPA: NAD-dependent epimerase/dehydratase family protein [Candidatus Limnocylindrales bacterium]|jgi:nucleoside-diphosphate-sugar epimerase